MTPAKKNAIIASAKSGKTAAEIVTKHGITMASAASYVARHNPKNVDSWNTTEPATETVTVPNTPQPMMRQASTRRRSQIVDTSLINRIIIVGNSSVEIEFQQANENGE